MTILVSTAVIIVSIMLWATLRKQGTDTVTGRTPRLVPVYIACGNCAGDEEDFRKTQLSEDDTCMDCGGTSYILAASIRKPPRLALVPTYPKGDIRQTRIENRRRIHGA